MKTAISVPDDVFEAAEDLARSSGRSRSELYSTALREYVARHADDPVTRAMDAVVRDLGEEPIDQFVERAGRQALRASDW